MKAYNNKIINLVEYKIILANDFHIQIKMTGFHFLLLNCSALIARNVPKPSKLLRFF